MAGNGLEDQVRNMILTGSSTSPTGTQPQRQTQPAATVRLPPTGQFSQPHQPHQTPVQGYSQTHQPRQPYQHHQPQHGRGYGYTPNRGQHHQFQNQGYPSRGRGRGFPQGSQGPQYQPQQYHNVDPNAFIRGGRGRGASPGFGPPPPQQQRHLYYPSSTPQPQHNFLAARVQYLETVAASEIPMVEMSQTERDAKESFRKDLERICQEVCASDPERLPEVSIKGFGSFESGFASAGSDMDLVLVVKDSDPTASASCFSPMEYDLPRSLEKRLLQLGIGAHLLTRTRVPIIKVCQEPSSSLLSKLRQEREKWDDLDHDKKYPHLRSEEDDHAEDDLSHVTAAVGNTTDETAKPELEEITTDTLVESANTVVQTTTHEAAIATVVTETETEMTSQPTAVTEGESAPKPKREPWTRERKAGPLDFPKDGVGIQTDINFFNPLGIHNTQMLRCYSLCDPRVRPMILFVKSWVKRRKINSSYSGTLSSYGYVLMVLHYLTNIANPPVLPNLQLPWRPHDRFTAQSVDRVEVEGWEVDFWRREEEIKEAAKHGVLTRNREPLGSLLAGFFQYYSSQGGYPSFHWMGQVLSLRSKGGLVTKEEKGWVKAVTEQGAGKQVQHRYLFCIEDPFEHSHNVARTVTHNGIVAIRDEFRRAYRILRAIGDGHAVPRDGGLFDELVEDDTAAETPAPNWNGGRAQQSAQQPQPQQRPQRQHARPPVQPKALNVTDTDDFPSLGGPKTK